MTTEVDEFFETVRNALEPKYDFPYYALVRIYTKRYGTIHIPAPFFNGVSNRSKWAGNLTIASDKRDDEYYECPFCGEKSFFSGICQNCKCDFEVWDANEEEWIDGQLPIEYQNHEALKKSVEKEILYKLDHKILDLGIISAEIVLPVPQGYPWETSLFLKESTLDTLIAFNRIKLKMNKFKKFIEIPEVKKILNDIVCETGVSFDYIDGDVTEVEGSEELRRQVNGVWQHKHEGYDYWHPMASIHKL